MSDWHISFGMGENNGSFISWGFGWIKKVIQKIVSAIKKIVKEKRVYTCPQCGTVGVLHNQFYKIPKFESSSIYEIKCGSCYTVVREVEN